MNYTFKKGEKLKSRKLIEQLFMAGKKITSFPIVLMYLPVENHTSEYRIQTGFSVPKRLYKRAVDRNRLKRLMREAYRYEKNRIQHLNKENTKKYIFMFIFIADEKIAYKKITEHMQNLIDIFIKKNHEN